MTMVVPAMLFVNNKRKPNLSSDVRKQLVAYFFWHTKDEPKELEKGYSILSGAKKILFYATIGHDIVKERQASV